MKKLKSLTELFSPAEIDFRDNLKVIGEVKCTFLKLCKTKQKILLLLNFWFKNWS